MEVITSATATVTDFDKFFDTNVQTRVDSIFKRIEQSVGQVTHITPDFSSDLFDTLCTLFEITYEKLPDWYYNIAHNMRVQVNTYNDEHYDNENLHSSLRLLEDKSIYPHKNMIRYIMLKILIMMDTHDIGYIRSVLSKELYFFHNYIILHKV